MLADRALRLEQSMSVASGEKSFAFSLEELQRLTDLVKNAQSLDEVWPILDRLRAARD